MKIRIFILILSLLISPVRFYGQNLINSGAIITETGEGSYWRLSGGTFSLKSQVADKVSFDNLAIAAGASLIIDPLSFVSVNGTLTNSAGTSGLVIQSDADGTGSLIHGTAGVNATVERYMTGITEGVDKWHIISSPVVAQNINAFLTGTDPVNGIDSWNNAGTLRYALAPYVESSNMWSYLTAAVGGVLEPGKGYEVLRTDPTGHVHFIGALNSAAVSAAVTKTGTEAATGWNLIGNPYPASLNVAAFLTANTTPTLKFETGYSVIYVWKSATAAYEIIAALDGYNVPPGMGFFVKVATTVTSVDITPAMRTHTQSVFKSGQATWPTIRLIAGTAAKSSFTRILFIPGMTRGLDDGYDAGVFNGNKAEFELYTHLIDGGGIDLGLQSLPDNDYENLVIPVGLTMKQSSQVVIKAEISDLPAGIKVYLEDKSNGKFTRLDESGSSYTTYLSAPGATTGRFYLHTKQGLMGIDENPLDNLTVIPLPDQQLIRVIGPVELPAYATVYDLNGRLVKSVSLTNPAENVIPLPKISNGIYLLNISTEKASVKRKIGWAY